MRRIHRDESGQGLVEYALIIALVSLAAIVALGFLSGKINDLFSKAGNSLNGVEVAAGGTPGGGGPPPPASAPSGGTVSITSQGGGSQPGFDDFDTLRATTSGWSNDPTSYTYTWETSTNYADPDNGGNPPFDGDETCTTLNNYDNSQGPTTNGSTTNDYVTPSQTTGTADSVRVTVTATNGVGTSTSVSACVVVQNA
jgi:pilus assembly protein Flp/PilA